MILTAARLRLLMHCVRPGGPDGDLVARVEAKTAAEPSLAAEWRRQVELDAVVAEALGKLEVPAAHCEEVASLGRKLKEKRPPYHASRAVLLAVAAGVVVLLLLGLWAWNQSQQKFQGQDEVVELLRWPAKMEGTDFEEIQLPLGRLGDWLLTKGFERFRVPAGLEGVETEATAVIDYKGTAVAVLAMRPKSALGLVFPATPLGVAVGGNGDWHVFEIEEDEQGPSLVAALQESGGTVFLLAFHGTLADMNEFLSSHPPQP